jgi:hypothetical protein
LGLFVTWRREDKRVLASGEVLLQPDLVELLTDVFYLLEFSVHLE